MFGRLAIRMAEARVTSTDAILVLRVDAASAPASKLFRVTADLGFSTLKANWLPYCGVVVRQALA